MNKPPSLVIVTIFVISVVGCTTPQITPSYIPTTLTPTLTLADSSVTTTERLSAEVAVYTALFAEKDLFGSVSGTILVAETTIPYSNYSLDEFDKITVEIPATQAETWYDFVNQNHTTHHFSNDLEFGRPTIFIKDGELEPIFETRKDEEDGGWRTFYEVYPNSNGISAVSRVGLNATRTQAIVYISHVCDVLCLTSALYLYEKQNNEWIRVDYIILGES